MKKYELLTNDKIGLNGISLYRVKALRSFGDVKAGDLGGYIEGEHNLSHEGDCWVGGRSCVYGNAQVFGDAEVGGNAHVFGYATVSDGAHVSGSARVSCGARVSGNAQVICSATVCGDAEVYGDALVSGNAEVSSYAQVFDDARVYGNALVGGDAEVYGDALVFGDTVVTGEADISTRSGFVLFTNVGSENGILTVYKGKDGTLWATRGCFTGTVEEFLDKSKQVHDERVHREYQLLIEVAKSRILGEEL